MSALLLAAAPWSFALVSCPDDALGTGSLFPPRSPGRGEPGLQAEHRARLNKHIRRRVCLIPHTTAWISLICLDVLISCKSSVCNGLQKMAQKSTKFPDFFKKGKLLGYEIDVSHISYHQYLKCIYMLVCQEHDLADLSNLPLYSILLLQSWHGRDDFDDSFKAPMSTETVIRRTYFQQKTHQYRGLATIRF